MKLLSSYARKHARVIIWLSVALVSLGLLLGYKLGSLTGGLSSHELAAAAIPVGWHGIYHQPFDLPLNLARSAVFFAFPDHGQILTRLPNAFFGALTIGSFVWLIRQWHGARTAVLAGALFATSAWVLHVSRLASFDVLYLWAVPTLLLTGLLLKKYSHKAVVWYGSVFVWCLMLYIPGLVWLVILSIYFQRKDLARGWKCFGAWWQRGFYLLAGLSCLPLLAFHLYQSGKLLYWLGLPGHFDGLTTVAKQFGAVPVHLFIRGPQNPELWLGRAPVMGVFALAACAIGIYFYSTHRKAARSKLLACLLIAGIVLVGAGGPVSLSLLVPLLYIAAATGIAYLLREWMRVFPNNPLARGLGLGLVTVAVGLSCLYGLRSYFIAWPHNQVTKTVFQNRL